MREEPEITEGRAAGEHYKRQPNPKASSAHSQTHSLDTWGVDPLGNWIHSPSFTRLRRRPWPRQQEGPGIPERKADRTSGKYSKRLADDRCGMGIICTNAPSPGILSKVGMKMKMKKTMGLGS